MNLQFTNKGGNFVSEFEVTSDFNLHIEGVRLSDMHIYQKTAGGSYAKVTDFPSERSQDRVADFDFASLAYPKFIKVVCATEPTYAEIATDGEVTEIKSQSKEVEITSNGVTEIAPDAGFGYLSGVKVNVNVPQSGGSGATTGYYRIDWDKAKELGYKPLRDFDSIVEYADVLSSPSGQMYAVLGGAQFVYLDMVGAIGYTGLFVPTIIQMKQALDFSHITKIAFTPHWGQVDTELVGNKPTPIYGEVTFDFVLKGNTFAECFIPITKEEFYA